MDQKLTKKTISFIALLTIFPTIIFASESGWPIYQRDAIHNGVSLENEVDPPLGELWTLPPLGHGNGLGMSSPVVSEETVYIGDGSTSLQAIDVFTREIKWKKDLGIFGDEYRSHNVLNAAVYKDTVFAGTTWNAIKEEDPTFYALDVNDGHIKWHFTTRDSKGNYFPRTIQAPPTVYEDVVYFTSLGGGEGSGIYAIDVETGELLWEFFCNVSYDGNYPSSCLTSPAIHNGIVYVGNYDNDSYALYAINADTGNLVWKFPFSKEIDSSPTIYNGIVYFLAYDDESRKHLYGLNAETGEGGSIFEIDGAGLLWASPAITEDVAYVGVGDTFYAIDLTTKSEKWRYTTPSPAKRAFRSSPAISGRYVYAGTSKFKEFHDYGYGIYCFNKDTGEMLDYHHLTYDLVGTWVSSPAISNGIIFVGSNGGELFAVNTTTPTTCNSCSDCQNKINSLNSGDTVYLTDDIASSDTCIELVYVDGVTFDCQGYKIKGDFKGYGINLRYGSGNTIKNCDISQFEDGIYFEITDNNVFVQNTIYNNSDDGIELLFSDGNTFSGNTVQFNSYAGFYLDASDNNILNDNMLKNNSNSIYLWRSETNSFTENTAQFSYRGIRLSNSHYNVFTNNTANNNSNEGIWIDESNNNKFTSNMANYNLYPFVIG